MPAVHVFASLASTMDVAHAAAADGAPAGTVIVADVQTAGRGRNGRRWVSESGAGVWVTVVERPSDPNALAVLSLRVGLALADALQPFVPMPIALKWPNDLQAGGRKLAGVLVEARWRDALPEWVAVGVGVNRVTPLDVAESVGIGEAAARHEILRAVVRAVRAAAGASGVLDERERSAFAARDAVRGREVVRPVAGRAVGVSARGELLVRGRDGQLRAVPTATVEYSPAKS